MNLFLYWHSRPEWNELNLQAWQFQKMKDCRILSLSRNACLSRRCLLSAPPAPTETGFIMIICNAIISNRGSCKAVQAVPISQDPVIIRSTHRASYIMSKILWPSVYTLYTILLKWRKYQPQKMNMSDNVLIQRGYMKNWVYPGRQKWGQMGMENNDCLSVPQPPPPFCFLYLLWPFSFLCALDVSFLASCSSYVRTLPFWQWYSSALWGQCCSISKIPAVQRRA